MRIAVVGSGISGLLAANLLASEHEVSLLESAPTLGGHTCTLDVDIDGTNYPVDTGFMVFNERTYPNFCKLLDKLEIESQPTDMSFGVKCERTGLEYEGSLGGLFAQLHNLLSVPHYCMIADILRFNREAPQLLASPEKLEHQSLGEIVRERGYSRRFIDQYLIPMGAAIWSARPEKMLDFPALFILRFFHNHGLLQVLDRPVWRTIPGGARRYIAKLITPLAEVRTSTPVTNISREAGSVYLTTPLGVERFDHVVLASHADQSLAMLSDADQQERRLLSAFPYQPNEVVIHTDTTILPRARRAWASWNYLTPKEGNGNVAVTYDLTRLQNVRAPRPILATLNFTHSVEPSKRIQVLQFSHPVFGPESLGAQAAWKTINGPRNTWFCGAYWRNGFHEDGVVSALQVAREFGKDLDSCRVVSTKEGFSTAASAL